MWTSVTMTEREDAMRQASSYPVRFAVDYPDRTLNRLTTFFRLITIIPIAILAGLLTGSSWDWSSGSNQDWSGNGQDVVIAAFAEA